MEQEVVSRLTEWGGIVTVLLMVVLGLAWFCRHLIQRNTILSDRFADVVEKNTQAFVELREAIKNVNR